MRFVASKLETKLEQGTMIRLMPIDRVNLYGKQELIKTSYSYFTVSYTPEKTCMLQERLIYRKHYTNNTKG